jgi:hypothetical protein
MGETRKFTILHSNDMHGDFLAEVKAGSGHLIGGLALFALITFVLTAIVQLIHDIDNPFEYNKNTVAEVDVSVLFKLESFWKSGQTNQNLK